MLHRAENCFAELVARWGIMWRRMRVTTAHATDTLKCLCRLHNICVSQRNSKILHKTCGADQDGGFEDVPEATPLPADPLDEEPPQIRRASDQKQARRDVLAAALKRAKQWRPRSSQYSYVRGTMAQRARSQSLQNGVSRVVLAQLQRELRCADSVSSIDDDEDGGDHEDSSDVLQ